MARSCNVEAKLESSDTGPVELRFDKLIVSGESRDIALIRLRCALLEEKQYGPVLVKSLGRRLTASL